MRKDLDVGDGRAAEENFAINFLPLSAIIDGARTGSVALNCDGRKGHFRLRTV
jgi:hypothetical protein